MDLAALNAVSTINAVSKDLLNDKSYYTAVIPLDIMILVGKYINRHIPRIEKNPTLSIRGMNIGLCSVYNNTILFVVRSESKDSIEIYNNKNGCWNIRRLIAVTLVDNICLIDEDRFIVYTDDRNILIQYSPRKDEIILPEESDPPANEVLFVRYCGTDFLGWHDGHLYLLPRKKWIIDARTNSCHFAKRIPPTLSSVPGKSDILESIGEYIMCVGSAIVSRGEDKYYLTDIHNFSLGCNILLYGEDKWKILVDGQLIYYEKITLPGTRIYNVSMGKNIIIFWGPFGLIVHRYS